MESIRKWFYKPKRDDPSLLAQFFYADEALNLVAAELDSFDGRKDPERCTALVNHLRQCQDKVLTICNRIMDDIIPTERANRDFRVKFPDDVMQENLAGQLWFGAECLAAGSSIMNREGESSAMRPLAKALTKALENVRNLLREQCLRGNTSSTSLKANVASNFNEVFGERLQEALKIFDRLFAEFELCYVSAMVPVKSTKEYELQQLVVVLFSETLQRALKMKLLTQEMVDMYDPALMFTIPRLAIVSGLLIFPDGPLCLDRTPSDMSEMFRPFRTLLHKIRELLWTLNNKELFTLEKLLCSSEDPVDFRASGQSVEIHDAAESFASNNLTPSYPTVPDLDEFVARFYSDYPSCKQFVKDFYESTSTRIAGGDTLDSQSRKVNDSASRNSNVTESHVSVPSMCKTEDGEEVVPSWENAEDSEDETEWVGETSECETVVTDAYHETEEIGSSVESDSKTVVFFPEDSASQKNSPITECAVLTQPGLRESLLFGEHINPEQESCSSHLDCEEQEGVMLESQDFTSSLVGSTSDSENSESCNHVTCSETIKIPSPVVSGFLLANQVGHESMLASMERLSPRIPDLSPTAGGSLPDGDSREALSVATATLSTLLLSSPDISPVGGMSKNLENDVEEDSSVQSPLDSGVGTVVSCSDTGSFSDRSPDTASVPALITSGTKGNVENVSSSIGTAQTSYDNAHKFQQRWQVETIPCSCTLSDRPTVSTNFGRCSDPLQDCTSDLYAKGCDVRTLARESGATADVGRCCLSAGRKCNNDICDNMLDDGSGVSNIESIVACQDCLLPIEVENLDKEKLLSPDLKSFEVLNDECEEFTSYTITKSDRCDRVLCDETTPESFSSCSNILRDSKEETSVLISDNLRHSFTDVHSAALCNTNVPQDCQMSDKNDTSRESGENAVEQCSSRPAIRSHSDKVETCEHKPLPSIVVKLEEGQKEGAADWDSATNEGGQCTLCSSSEIGGAQSQTPDRLLNYAGNWEHLMRKQPASSKLQLGPECSTTVTSHVERNIVRVRRSRKPVIQASSSNNVSSSLSSANDTNSQQGGSTLTVVPSRNGSCSMSSETSSFNSECQDDEEIALAMQAAEIANRNEARAKFRSSEDLVHRLFVCIAGVADQLQTNFAGDLRHILKCVFLMSASNTNVEDDDLEESPVTTETVEQGPPSPPPGDSGELEISFQAFDG
ncbi:hypothetical protein ANN_02148 [Periplaneta americana]|uniref:Lateral signaling target protein 2 homolog n=1 Tax=Periplaneta americana TaxID=6978 RepID=A0ABQ8TVJ3_PERAM|nr:hypothetical protein ANN_02148 [Periplaneta americana]